MSEQGTIEGILPEFGAWLAASDDERSIEPATAAGVLADLFTRAERGGGDLHDPTAELLRWLTRDLDRDDDATAEDYRDAITTLPHYLLFLRAHQLWRRSEHEVRECWDVLGGASQPPLGLMTLGSTIDAAIADRLSRLPDPDQLLAVGVERAFAAPLQATLNALADRGELSRAEVGDLVGLPHDSVALAVWTQGLHEADLAREDEDGQLSPRPDVSEAGGCPPPSTYLVQRVVRGLVRAVALRTITADVEAELVALPRAMGTIVALVGSTDEGYYVAEDEDDEEATTEEAAGMFVEQSLPQASEEERALLVAEVLDGLESLVRFGVLERVTLDRGGIALLAPEVFRYAVIRAVSDVTGCVGTPDETAVWEPVEPPFRMAPDVGVDLLVSLEHDPQVWRRLRILGAEPLEYLHATVQVAFGWRDVRSNLFCSSDGTRRFAPRWLLGGLRSEKDAAVVDSGSVRIGSVLKAAGDELVYLYGYMSNPWRVRIRVERVLSGMKESIAWLDGGGQGPYEPTRIGEAMRQRLPEGMTIPDELERAWAFMEVQRWMLTTDDGVELAAPGPPEARPGVVFSSGLSLAHKVGENSPVLVRTHQIAISPDGTSIALWLDDDDATRVVSFGPDGEASLLGDGALDLLRLAAIGYEEISPRVLGDIPKNPEAVVGVEVFREWVRGQLGVDVPHQWGPLGNDRFTAWVDARRGESPADPA